MTAPEPRRSRKRLVALIAAGVLVVSAGITGSVFAVASHNAETERLCAEALDGAAAARKTLAASTEAGEGALTAVESTALADGGTSAPYAGREGATELLVDVADKLDGAKGTELSESCDTRDDAEASQTSLAPAAQIASDLDDAVEALLADFDQHQADETARIAAEKKAAEEAAAAAAQAEAERVAAEEAARQAAERDAWDDYDPGYSGGGDGGNGGAGDSGGGEGGGGGSGGSGGGTQIAPPPGQSGGGCPPSQPVCYG